MGVTRLVTRSNYFQKNLEILERPQRSWSLSSVLPFEPLASPETVKAKQAPRPT